MPFPSEVGLLPFIFGPSSQNQQARSAVLLLFSLFKGAKRPESSGTDCPRSATLDSSRTPGHKPAAWTRTSAKPQPGIELSKLGERA